MEDLEKIYDDYMDGASTGYEAFQHIAEWLKTHQALFHEAAMPFELAVAKLLTQLFL